MNSAPPCVRSLGARWRGACLLWLWLCLPSCSYLKNRTNDLLDVFWVDVGVGTGVYVDARASDFLWQGVGFHSYAEVASLHGRFAGSPDHMRGFGLPTLWLLGYTICDYRPREWGLLPVLDGDRSKYDLNMEQPWSSYCLFFPGLSIVDPPPDVPSYSVGKRGLRVADVGVHVQCLVGARLGLSPGEFLDLLLGFVGIDLGGDDAFGASPPDRARQPDAREPYAGEL